MLICGLDPGLVRTGYGIVEGDTRGLRLLDAGLVKAPIRTDLGTRLAKLYQEVRALLAEYPALDAVAVEDLYSHYKHPKTAVLMAHARGVLLLAAKDRRVEVVSLGATEVKKAVTGYGHASKEQIQRSVLSRFGIVLERNIPADVTDAVALAICAVEHLRTRQRNGG